MKFVTREHIKVDRVYDALYLYCKQKIRGKS